MSVRKNKGYSVGGNLARLSNEDLELVFRHFKEEHNLEKDQVIGFLRKDKAVGISIFCKELSALEAIVKFLKEKGFSFKEISKLLNRKYSTIYTTYNKAKAKFGGALLDDSKLKIPLSIFTDRKYSVLESLVSYLKTHDYTYHQIAIMLKRDDRTIWTVYNRAIKK